MYCTISKYLQTKYDSIAPTTMTGLDAKTMGIPYPLKAGWFAKYGPNPLSEKQVEKMILAIARRAKSDPKPTCIASMQLARLTNGLLDLPAQPIKPTTSAMPEEKKAKKPGSYDGFYESREWRELRYKALVMHGPTCQCCGATRGHGVVIHVDHVKPRSKFPALQLDLSNLQILCDACNLGKSNKDQTDWR